LAAREAVVQRYAITLIALGVLLLLAYVLRTIQ
jgi:hypothetical protein